jgi:hypothetical protein
MPGMLKITQRAVEFNLSLIFGGDIGLGCVLDVSLDPGPLNLFG